MQSRKFQCAVVALFVVFSAWLVPASAGVIVTPAAPTTIDNVQIAVTIGVPTPCYNVTASFSVVANLIRIDTTATAPPSVICAQVIVDRTVTVPVGTLAAGNYAVEVYNRWNTATSFELIFTTSLDVTAPDVVASDVVVVRQEGQAVHPGVTPLPPSNYDVELLSAWVMPSACFTSSGATTVSGNTIQAEITVTSTGTTCAPQLSRGTYFSGSLGDLTPGIYTVATSFNGVPGISRELTIMPAVTPTDATMLVTPSVPSSADNVSVLVSAVLPSSCYEYLGNRVVTNDGSEIRLDIPLVGTHAGCVELPTPHETQFYPGKMTPGTYTVRAYYNGALGLTSSLHIKPTADLVLSQTVAPNPVRRGRFVIVRINLVNNGPDAVSATAVSSVLPANLSYVATSASKGRCSVANGRDITCALGALGVGATAQVGILARARSTGTASLTSTVSSEAVDNNSANDSASSDIQVRR